MRTKLPLIAHFFHAIALAIHSQNIPQGWWLCHRCHPIALTEPHHHYLVHEPQLANKYLRRSNIHWRRWSTVKCLRRVIIWLEDVLAAIITFFCSPLEREVSHLEFSNWNDPTFQLQWVVKRWRSILEQSPDEVIVGRELSRKVHAGCHDVAGRWDLRKIKAINLMTLS